MAGAGAETSVMDATRRGFLRGIVSGASTGAGRAASGIPLGPATGRGVAEPSGTLVFVNLVGGLDGLSVLVPHGDPAYGRRRPGLAVGPPGERYSAIDLGRGLGLHPALVPLHEVAGRADRLAVIAGVGIPDGHDHGRHVPARAFLQQGGAGESSGWAARLLQFEGMGMAATWSFGDSPHRMFDGLGPVLVEETSVALAAVNRSRGSAGDVPERGSSPSPVPRWSDTPWPSPADRLTRGYPEGRLARSLAVTADLIRTDPGLRIVGIDQSGYDTHVDQGDARSGVLTHKLDRLARALAAFWIDLSEGGRGADSASQPVTVVVVSEFGRAIDENGSGGTEHGRAGVALAFGDLVVGGVHGDVPSIERDESWPVTIDVRRVLADAAASHGFRPWRSGVFAGLSLPNRSLGLLLSS